MKLWSPSIVVCLITDVVWAAFLPCLTLASTVLLVCPGVIFPINYLC